MRSLISRLRLIVSAVVAAALAACGPGAPPAADNPAGTSQVSVAALESDVAVRPNAVDDFTPAEAGQTLPLGGQLRVGSASWAMLDLGNGDRAHVGSLTRLALERQADASGVAVTRVRLPYGKLWLNVTGSRFEAVTPSGVVSAEGAYAEVFYSLGTDAASAADDVLEIRCLQGQCKFANIVNLGALQQLTVTGGGLTITGPTALPDTALEAFLAVFPPQVARSPRGSAEQPGTPLVSAGDLPAPTSLVPYGPEPPEGVEATSTGTATATPTAPAGAPVVFVLPTATPTSTESPSPTDQPSPTPTEPAPAQPPPAQPPTNTQPPAPSEPEPTQTPAPSSTPVTEASPTNPPPTPTTAPTDTPTSAPTPTSTRRPPDTKTPPPPTDTPVTEATPTHTPVPTKTPSPTPLIQLTLPFPLPTLALPTLPPLFP